MALSDPELGHDDLQLFPVATNLLVQADERRCELVPTARQPPRESTTGYRTCEMIVHVRSEASTTAALHEQSPTRLHHIPTLRHGARLILRARGRLRSAHHAPRDQQRSGLTPERRPRP